MNDVKITRENLFGYYKLIDSFLFGGLHQEMEDFEENQKINAIECNAEVDAKEDVPDLCYSVTFLARYPDLVSRPTLQRILAQNKKLVKLRKGRLVFFDATKVLRHIKKNYSNYIVRGKAAAYLKDLKRK